MNFEGVFNSNFTFQVRGEGNLNMVGTNIPLANARVYASQDSFAIDARMSLPAGLADTNIAIDVDHLGRFDASANTNVNVGDLGNLNMGLRARNQSQCPG